jgi:hypothetical protein
MSLTQWQARLSGFGLVSLVTVLIWIWAAGETRVERSFEATISLEAPDPARMQVDATSPSFNGRVGITARGSQRAVRDLQIVVSQRLELLAGSGGIPTTEGISQVSLARAIADLPSVRATGAVIDAVDPASIEIRIDLLERGTLRVVPEFAGTQTQGDVVVEPPIVSARLPAAAWREGRDPVARAVFDRRDLESLEPGRRYTLDAQVQLPPPLAAIARGAATEPTTVKVTFTPRSRDRTTTLASVPVQVAGPAEEFAKHRVEVDPGFLRQVVLSGPAEAIARIEERRERIVAFVHLDSTELALRVPSKRISLWLLPPGVRVVQIGDSEESLPEIGLRILEPSAVEGATPPPAATGETVVPPSRNGD